MSKRPARLHYYKDDLTDVQLRMASWASRGIWATIVNLMCGAPEYGRIAGNITQLCNLVAATEAQMNEFLSDLRTCGFGDLEQDGQIFTITCRRMVREIQLDERKREQARTRQRNKRQRDEAARATCHAENHADVTHASRTVTPCHADVSHPANSGPVAVCGGYHADVTHCHAPIAFAFPFPEETTTTLPSEPVPMRLENEAASIRKEEKVGAAPQKRTLEAPAAQKETFGPNIDRGFAPFAHSDSPTEGDSETNQIESACGADFDAKEDSATHTSQPGVPKCADGNETNSRNGDVTLQSRCKNQLLPVPLPGVELPPEMQMCIGGHHNPFHPLQVAASCKSEIAALVELAPEKERVRGDVRRLIAHAYETNGFDYARRNIEHANTHAKTSYAGYLAKTMANDFAKDDALVAENSSKAMEAQENRTKTEEKLLEQEFVLAERYFLDLPQAEQERMLQDAMKANPVLIGRKPETVRNQVIFSLCNPPARGAAISATRKEAI